MDLDVDLLVEREASRAARLLARAFAADPVIGYYLTPGWRRPAGFRAFFRAALYETCRTGRCTRPGTPAGSLASPPGYLPTRVMLVRITVPALVQRP